jgi:two-component sensor histidine kinase
VTLSWASKDTEPSVLSLRWQERGGPPVTAPSHEGFGSRLVKRGLSQELGGPVDIDYAADGVICKIDFPVNGG